MANKPDIKLKRERAQILTYDAIQQLMLQNVSKTSQKTFTQYTKENIITYLQSPVANIDNIREVSRFLTRYSMIYKKLISYYATTPLYYYHIDPTFDLNKGLDFAKVSKNYYTVLQRLQQVNMSREMSNIVAIVMVKTDFGYKDLTQNTVRLLERHRKVNGYTDLMLLILTVEITRSL